MKRIYKIAIYFLGFLFISLIAIIILARVTSLQPPPQMEKEVVCPKTAPVLQKGSKIKVLNWNVQFLAGKNYVFFYSGGPDVRPSSSDIEKTSREIARIILAEKPDIILLQEVDDGAKRTDYEDQLQKILKLLPVEYACYASAFYWKNAFNPHPKILGSTGMKVSTISKYKISQALRFQLPTIPDNFLVKNFNLKRAILQTKLPLASGGELVVMNTHLDAFAQGYDTMQQQIDYVDAMLSKLKGQQDKHWFLGGDFNLLPPGFSLDKLNAESRAYYNKETEITKLFQKYTSVVTLADLQGDRQADFYTHLSNKFKTPAPSKPIDYIFYGNLQKEDYYVRSADALKISDHMPLIVNFTVGEY
ncbi:MAG: endonuclease/exonuclease/phosphatase family protein [Spirochaetota bacterium]